MTKDYKDTLFLPKTAFKMRGNLPQKEPEIINLWKDLNIDELRLKARKDAERFILHSGPPFANGHFHIGHALNCVLKDVIARFQFMLGKDVSFLRGWDCHGLPIEAKIESDLGKSDKSDFQQVRKFRRQCRRFAEKWLNIQKGELCRMGLLGDDEKYYSTMSPSSEKDIIELFFKSVRDGFVYRDVKPVLWSIEEESAFAEAEVVYNENHVSKAIYVEFDIKSAKKLNASNSDMQILLESASILIWTTTTWTIPCNRAVAFGDSIDYAIYEVTQNENKKRYLIDKNSIDEFLSKISCDKCEEIIVIKGKDLQNYKIICTHPFYDGDNYNFDIPLLCGSHVESGFGTGFVHTAPSHGIEDFELCKKHNIQAEYTVDEKGNYTNMVSLFSGKNIFKSANEIIKKLKEIDKLPVIYDFTHSYPYSWRSNTPMIYRITSQWFLNLDHNNIREQALSEIEKVSWLPHEKSKQRIGSMVKNRKSWCISRQRLWGVPMSLVVNKNTHEINYNEEFAKELLEIVNKESSDICFDNDFISSLIKKHYKNHNELYFVNDILDVWFESGSTHEFVTKKMLNSTKADIYVEGSDQHRGWFQSSLLLSCINRNGAPYKNVYTHGFIVNSEGKKMSKSADNYISAEEFIGNHGVDILRLWVLSSDAGSDIALSENIIQTAKDNYRKIRNVIRYLLSVTSELTNGEYVNYDSLSDLEKSILHKITIYNEDLLDMYKNYKFPQLVHGIHDFCNDISSIYLDVKKDSLYCDDKKDKYRRGTRTVMRIILDHILRWLAPIIPFTSDEAWSVFKGNVKINNDFYNIFNSNESFQNLIEDEKSVSVHLQEFLPSFEKWKNTNAFDKYTKLVEFRKTANLQIESMRREGKIGSNLQCEIDIICDEKTLNMLNSFTNKELRDFFTVSRVSLNIGDEMISVSIADGNKCERCWIITDSNSSLCDRCDNFVRNNE